MASFLKKTFCSNTYVSFCGLKSYSGHFLTIFTSNMWYCSEFFSGQYLWHNWWPLSWSRVSITITTQPWEEKIKVYFFVCMVGRERNVALLQLKCAFEINRFENLATDNFIIVDH